MDLGAALAADAGTQPAHAPIPAKQEIIDPSRYSDEPFFRAVLEAYVQVGGILPEAIAIACKATGHKPVTDQWFWNVLARHEYLREDYVRAWRASCGPLEQRMLAEAMADCREVTHTAEGPVLGKVDRGAVDRAKLRMQAFQWMLARRNPKTYGDKVDVSVAEVESLDPAKIDQELARSLGMRGVAAIGKLGTMLGLAEPTE